MMICLANVSSVKPPFLPEHGSYVNLCFLKTFLVGNGKTGRTMNSLPNENEVIHIRHKR